MLWILTLYGFLFLFLTFEGSQADELINDGVVKISYDSHDLLITWKEPRDLGLKLHVQLLCGPAQSVVGDESIDASVGQVTMKNIGPSSECQIKSRSIPDSGLEGLLESRLFTIPDDTSPPSSTLSSFLPPIITQIFTHASVSSSPPTPTQIAPTTPSTSAFSPIPSETTPSRTSVSYPNITQKNPTTSAEAPPIAPSTAHSKFIVGPVVGGVLGGLSLFSLVVVALVMLRRRRSSKFKTPVVVPFVHEPGRPQPLDERALLEELPNHKNVEAERQRDIIQAEIEDNRTSQRLARLRQDPDAPADVEAVQLRRQVELLNGQINEMVIHQRELNMHTSTGLVDDLPPPYYSPSVNGAV